jgi:transposase
MENDDAAFIAVDWADQKHVYCLQVAGESKKESGTLEQRPEVIGPWVAKLRERFEGRPIAVAVEQSRGALIHALMSYDFIVIYPIHPNTVARFRQAFKSSGAKTDPLDADQILQILTKHMEFLKPLEPDTEETRLLGRLVEDRRKAVNLRTKHIQALEAALKEYYPQALELCSGNLTSRFAGDLLKKWPSMEAFQQAKPGTIKKFYYGHNIRSSMVVEEAVRISQHARILTTDAAIVESGSRLTLMYSELIKTLNKNIADYDKRIEQVFNNHPEAKIFGSLPGAGDVMAPRLVAFFGTDRTRFQSADNVASFTGIGPVTQSSGKSKSYTPAGLARSLTGRPFTSLPESRFHTANGPAITFNTTQRPKAKVTIPQFVRWLSSGSEFYSGAGKPARLTMMPNTWKRSEKGARSSPRCPEGRKS